MNVRTPESAREAGLAYLRAHASPASGQELARGAAAVSDLTVEFTPDGPPQFCCRRDNAAVFLHSRRRPAEEARRQTESCEPAGKTGCIVLGMAGGYHLAELARRMDPGTILLVIDLFPDRVAAAAAALDLPTLETGGVRPIFIVNSDPETVRREFRLLMKKQPRCDFAFFAHPGLMRLDGPEWRHLTEALREEIRLETSDRITRAVLADEWLLNAIDNLPQTLGSPMVDSLAHCFDGGTALVVAAGPTLGEALPMIRQLAPRCPVFTVGTAVKPLLRGGVVPDLVVTLDSCLLTREQIPDTGLEQTFLAASCSTPAGLVSVFAGRTFSFSFSGLKGFNRWMTRGGRRPPLLNVGGTVSLSAIDLALLTGCTTVILCGLDLAMTDDGTTHAQGSVYDGRRMAPETLVRVKGNYRDTVPTTPQFAGYIRQMNAYFNDVTSSGEVNFFNATTGGAMLEKTTVVRPEMLNAEAVCHGIDNAGKILADIAAARPGQEERKHWSDYLVGSAAALRDIAAGADAAARIAAGDGTGAELSPEEAQQLDGFDARLRQYRETDLLEQALESITLTICNGGTASGEARERSHRLYRGIADASEQLAQHLEAAAENFCQTKKQR